MGFGIDRIFLTVAVILGIIADIEGLVISLMLPVWTHHVKSLFHAWRIRTGSALATQNQPL